MVQTFNAADQNSYINEILSLLWPHASDVSPAEAKAFSMVALPHRQQPKLIIPRRPRRVAAAALRNYKASATGTERVMKRGVAVGARIGLLDFLPSRLTVSSSEAAIETRISSLLRTEVRVALYIGPPRAVQKPVLQVIDACGQTIAFAKLATKEPARSLIRREAETINRFRSAGLRTLATPEILNYSIWRGADLTVQSAIQPRGSKSRLRRLLPAATMELAECCGTQWEPWISSTYRARLITQLGGINDTKHAQSIRSGLDVLDRAVAGGKLEFGSWHGDWAPWNMTTVGHTVAVWDWEHFESGIPIGLDALHYVISESVMSGNTPTEAFRAALKGPLDPLVAAVCDPEIHTSLVLLYALELASRYLLDGESQVAGTSMSRVFTWLPEVLEECRHALGHDG